MGRLVAGVVFWAVLVSPVVAQVPDAADPTDVQLTFARDLDSDGGVHPEIGQRKVVHSIRLPGLDKSETLKVRAEVEVTTCEQSSKPAWQCGTPALHPRIVARLVLAGAADDPDGIALQQRGTRCVRHHCPLVLSRTLKVDEKQVRRSHLNLVIDSSAPGAGPGDEIEIKDPKSGKGGGHLTVLRFGPRYASAGAEARDDAEGVREIPTQTGQGNPEPKKTVVYSVELHDVQAGEILDVEGVLNTKMDPRVRRNGVPAVLASQVILADSPTARDVAEGWRRIAPNTGFNCARTCSARKVGATQVERALGTAYVNYVALSSRTTKRVDRACNDKCVAKVEDGGGVKVRRLLPGPPVARVDPAKEGANARPPEAVTTDTSRAQCRTVTFNGLVDAHGGPTLFRFVWKRAEGDERHYTAWREAGAGEGRTSVKEDVDGLVPDRDYEVKLVAENARGRSEGEWRRFRTVCRE
ncbi:MAG TPA: fibronectin type III domain-containing protein [Solirubrobacteraceae bacterium]|jgi:hypothetical protein